jgi:hypothetical protein
MQRHSHAIVLIYSSKYAQELLGASSAKGLLKNKEFMDFCATLVDTEQNDKSKEQEQVKNTVALLAHLDKTQRQKKEFATEIKTFLKDQFGADNYNDCRDKIVQAYPLFLTPSLRGVKPLGFADTTRFLFSMGLNRNNPPFNQMSPKIALGKIPTKFGERTLLQSHFTLAISAVNPGEFKVQKSISDILFWEEKRVEHIYLSAFIDYGRPYRNNPKKIKTNASKDNWDRYLNKLYFDIYYAAIIIKNKIDQGENVYIHCKAGKGRSVTTLAVYFMLYPDQLLTPNVQNDSTKSEDKTGNNQVKAKDIILAMKAKRPCIDSDSETIKAIDDCYDYIIAEEKRLGINSRDSLIERAKQHFNMPTNSTQTENKTSNNNN